jgi:(hydroxyamino)benzene mutase
MSNLGVQSGGRQILIHGMALVLVGLVWGFVVPLTPYPRLALGAHLQFETNGMLYIVLAILLLALPHRVGDNSVFVMRLSVWAAWSMAASEAANAWWGAARMMPIAASQAGAKGAEPWQELVLLLTHISAAAGLILSWILLMVGFIKRPHVVVSND